MDGIDNWIEMRPMATALLSMQACPATTDMDASFQRSSLCRRFHGCIQVFDRSGNREKITTVEHPLIALLIGLITGYLLVCPSPCCGSTGVHTPRWEQRDIILPGRY